MPRSRQAAAIDARAVERRLTALGGRGGDDAPAGDDARCSDDDDGDAQAGSGHRLRLDPGRPGAAVLCVVAVLSAALAAGVTWASRPSLEPVATAPVVTAGSAATTTAATTSATQVVVAVVGQVVTPGLVTLPAGSRVADAVAAAGGALPDADLATVNLARVLVDGEQVAVGVPGAAPVPGTVPGASQGGAGPGPVNLNTASEAELETLPGVGPVLAGRIAQWRTDNGGFTSVEQLQEVDGIGPSTFEELRDEVTV